MFEDTSAAGKEKEGLVGMAREEREDSPISDCESITVKEERILVEDLELENEKKKPNDETSTQNMADTQTSTEIQSEPMEHSETEEAQRERSRTAPDSRGTEAGENTETNGIKEAAEAGFRKSEEYRFFCKLCHIGFLKETSYKYHFANNIELHKKMKRTTGKVSIDKGWNRSTILLLTRRSASVMTVERALPVTSFSGSTCTTTTSWTILSSARSATSF